MNIKATYKADRAEIVWSDEEIEAFVKGAPEHVSRIVIAATETGFRPGDLHILSAFHVQKTSEGRRIVIRTSKRKRIAAVPVTDRMAELLDAQKAERILTTSQGQPWGNKNYLGDAVSTWRDRLELRTELRLQDCRGTAATRWLNHGLELREIATIMGWSIKHASEVIERYVALHPSMTDGVLRRIRENDAATKAVKSAVKTPTLHKGK
ncbi:MAG: tyrosine-type recombinase/integrase [Pseudomonadota bacterium]